MLTKEDRNSLIAKAQVLLSTKPFSKQVEAEFARTMQLVDVIDSDRKHERAIETLQGIEREQRDTRTLRIEEEFRHFLHRPSKRTYQALESGAIPGSVVVPTGQWKRDLLARMVSSSGWLRAGAVVAPTATGRPYITFFADDQANVASILSDNSPLPPANPVFAAPTTNAKTFATATILSMQLVQDVDGGSFDVSQHLAGLFGRRCGRKLNTYATNDVTDGLLAQLTVGATAASTSLPTYSELVDMQNQIDPDYLEADSAPCYMMSQSLRNLLLKQQASDGLRLYPEIQDGKLLGLPLITNVDMVATAASVAVVCGSVKRAVLVQDAGSLLIRSFERYAELAQVFYSFVGRFGVKLIDSHAVTALKLHA